MPDASPDLPPQALLRVVPAPDFDILATDQSASLPNLPGAYLIIVRLDDNLSISRPRLAILTPGWYLYAGSARGPGGLGARVRRHLAPTKPIRWHVDQLTVTSAGKWALAYSKRSECDLIVALTGKRGFITPIAGFGSSDCRHCASHLVQWRGKS